MAVKNDVLIGQLFETGGNDFINRIPNPDQAGIEATVQAILDPANKSLLWNNILPNLVQRVGGAYIRQINPWDNPLAVFKQNKIDGGAVAEEIATSFVKAHSYDPNATMLLQKFYPDAEAAFARINRADVYPITVNETEFRKALTAGADSYALNEFIASMMNNLVSADNWDEFTIMKEIIAKFDNEFGFYKHHLSAAPTDEATSKEFSKAVRTYAGQMKFPGSRFITGPAKNIPVYSKDSELVLLTTPEVIASVDVDVIASAFNASAADLKPRIVLVDEFPMPDVYAILTTDKFFMCQDSVLETTNFYDASSLTTTFYRHHQGIYSISCFCPAVVFTTASGTEIPTVTMTFSGLSVETASETAAPGDKVQLFLTAIGSKSGTGSEFVEIGPDNATFDVTCSRTVEGSTVAVDLNSRTYVDKYNVLHIQKTGLDADDVLTVTAKTTYLNPSTGVKSDATDTVTVTIA